VILRRGAFRPQVVHVRLADDNLVPALDDVLGWVDAIGADPTVATIRTSALFSKAADRFQHAGFEVADTLSLLRAELSSAPVRRALRAPTGAPRPAMGTANLRRRDYHAAAAVDRAAFGDSWALGPADLDEIRQATPQHRARSRFRRSRWFSRPIEAFAVAGASRQHGYLQRLAVDPAHQRRGHGRHLTADALRWMSRRGLRDCLVNTSVDNDSALALYESVGFHVMADQLLVLQLDVRSLETEAAP